MNSAIRILGPWLGGLALGALIPAAGPLLDKFTGPRAALWFIGALIVMLALALLGMVIFAATAKPLPATRPRKATPLHCHKNSGDVAPCERHTRRIATVGHDNRLNPFPQPEPIRRK